VLSYDLQEGKKSTPGRTGAPARKLASGRAGVEFFLDTDGAAGRSFNVEVGASVGLGLDRPDTRSGPGWGGSGREGKGYPQKPVGRRPWQAWSGWEWGQGGPGTPLSNVAPSGICCYVVT
jgi:hypothetical protein